MSQPAPPVDIVKDSTFVSVNIRADKLAFAGKVHIRTPVSDLIHDILRDFRREAVTDRSDVSYLNAQGVSWALEYGPTRKLIPLDMTLEEVDIRNGSTLYLTHRQSTESYPILRDDIAEGAVDVSKREFPIVEAKDTRTAALFAFPATAAIMALTGLGLISGDASVFRWPAVGVLGLIAFMTAALAVVLYQKPEDKNEDIAASLSVSAYIAAAAAGICAIPRDMSIWHIATAGAAVVTLMTILILASGNRPARLHVGVGVLAITSIVIGGLQYLINTSTQGLAVEFMAAAAVLMIWSTKSSRNIGGVQVNYIPTLGEPMQDRATLSVAEVSRNSGSKGALESMMNRETNVIAATNAMIGQAYACSAMSIVAATVAGWHTASYEWPLFAYVAAICIIMLSVSRAVAIRGVALPLLAAGVGTWAGYMVGRVQADIPPSPLLIGLASIILVVGVVVGSMWAIRKRRMHSPLRKRDLGWIAALAILSIGPLLVFIVGLLGRIRGM